jgi:polysaccharide export outer membrane protein
MRLPNLFFFILTLLVMYSLTSCVNTKQAGYFSDAEDTTMLVKTEDMDAIIQKNDIISVYITSLSPEASAVFNMPNTQPAGTSTTMGNSGALGGYLVNSEGNIQIPILGLVKAAGNTKKQLKADITNSLIEKKLLIDPIVTIRQLNYEVTVIGEVARPTVINVPSEKISLLKALGMAGDITVFGKKDNVMLIRDVEGKRKVKRINLNSKNFLTSGYYYLQPNDIVYVEPNKQKVINANRNPVLLPTILSSLSVLAIILTRVLN